jgi:hypothetical protein
MKDLEKTFVEKLYECNQHKKRLLSAKKRLSSIMPLTLKVYDTLDDDTMSVIDQMIFRFSKLQDTMGEKVFPTILELNGEDVKRLTFIDRLNRLEELELLYKNEWMSLRKERNEIAHEYTFNKEEVVDGINLIYMRVNKLLEIYQLFYEYSVEKFEFIRDSKVLG